MPSTSREPTLVPLRFFKPNLLVVVATADQLENDRATTSIVQIIGLDGLGDQEGVRHVHLNHQPLLTLHVAIVHVVVQNVGCQRDLFAHELVQQMVLLFGNEANLVILVIDRNGLPIEFIPGLMLQLQFLADGQISCDGGVFVELQADNFNHLQLDIDHFDAGNDFHRIFLGAVFHDVFLLFRASKQFTS